MVEVNGQQYQHATTRFVLIGSKGNFRLKTVTKLDYEVGAAKEITTDSQGQPDGFVFKKTEHAASMTLKLAEWYEVREWLSQQSGLGVLQSQCDFAVTKGNRINAVKTDTLRQMMIQKEARKSEDSQEPDMVDVPLIFLKCDFAGAPAMVYEN